MKMNMSCWKRCFWLSIAILLGLAFVPSLHAQMLTVLHNFTGGADGAAPWAGLTMDSTGNHLYGTARQGGDNGNGTVFRLTKTNGSWTFSPIYKFTGGSDGALPSNRVVIGPNGTLYGTANFGGSTNCTSNPGCGTVYNLTPPPTFPRTPLTPWRQTVIYSFQGGSDGAYPGFGDLTFDSSGNIYGTASQGGITASQCYSQGCGVVYKLTGSGQNFTQSLVYSFTGGSDGSWPLNNVVFDRSGNAYTTAGMNGTDGGGTVIELTPSGGGWTESTIHEFAPASDGSQPWAGLVFDASGNLYGDTSSVGPDGGGTAFELTPSGGSWTYSLLQSFSGGTQAGPLANLVMDASGNLYGTTAIAGAFSQGAVFKLTRTESGWTYSSLHDFTGGSDGGSPHCNVIFDSAGNIYGTTAAGGANGQGVVFEITP